MGVRENRRQSAREVHSPQSIVIRIEELVLHGFPQVNRYLVGEVVQAELQKLFAGRAIPSALASAGEYPEIAAGPMRLCQGSSAQTIGSEIARSVYEAVTAQVQGPGEAARRT